MPQVQDQSLNLQSSMLPLYYGYTPTPSPQPPTRTFHNNSDKKTILLLDTSQICKLDALNNRNLHLVAKHIAHHI